MNSEKPGQAGESILLTPAKDLNGHVVKDRVKSLPETQKQEASSNLISISKPSASKDKP